MGEHAAQNRKLGYVECPTAEYVKAKYGVDLNDTKNVYVWHHDDDSHLRGEWLRGDCASCGVEILVRLDEAEKAVCTTCFTKLAARVSLASTRGFRMGA